jgi:hypothetical protein
MNTCQIAWNASESQWEAKYKGQVIAKNSSFDKGVDYLKAVILGGLSKKAKNHNITAVDIVDASAPHVTTDLADAASPNGVPFVPRRTLGDEFSINERFTIMTDYVEMVAQRQLASALITGEGGLGKTFTVMKTLRDTGLKDVSKMDIGARFDGQRGYVVVKGYSTAKGLFRTLYDNRNQIVVFDDCDSILKDPNAVNLLKAALDSYDVRMVTWNAEGWGSDEDLPKTFEFEGGVIFISNLPRHKIPQAIRSRAIPADVSMTRAEVIERMHEIVKSDEFMPEFDGEHKQDALAFVAEHAENPMVTELNLRSLVNVVKVREAKPAHWKRLGLYAMIAGSDS